MAIKLRWFAASMALTAAVAACSQSVIDSTSSGTTGTAGSTGSGGAFSDSTSGTASAGGSTSTAAVTTGTTATTGSTSTSATTASTGTGVIVGACGGVDCTADQLCVQPACREVLGEECNFGIPDGGPVCEPGTVRGPQFDLDCVQPGYACVSGCPPKPPFCVDLPPGCGGVASCACLAMDPCVPSNSGACHDADISAGVLSCSLKP